MRADILRSYPALDPGRRARDLQRHRRRGVASRRGRAAARASSASTRARPVASCSSGASRAQKGLPYFLRAAARLPPDVQLIAVRRRAGHAADHGGGRGARAGVLQATRDGVVWLDRMLSRHELCTILTAATTFVCPSVYEPLGIVNLEAMACGAAVVGTATGGIPEVVVDGVTGRLVPIEQVDDGTGTPIDPERFSSRTLPRSSPRWSADPAAPRGTGRAGARARRGRLQLGADRADHGRAVRGGRGAGGRLGWTACRRCSSSPTSSSAGTPGTSSITSTGRSDDDRAAGRSSGPTARARPRSSSSPTPLHAPRRPGAVTILGSGSAGPMCFEPAPADRIRVDGDGPARPARGDRARRRAHRGLLGDAAAGTRTTRTSTSVARCGCSPSGSSTTSPTARFGTLSDGEQKRVQIARAGHDRPRAAAALDEPTAQPRPRRPRRSSSHLLGGYAHGAVDARDGHGHPPRRGDPAPASRTSLLHPRRRRPSRRGPIRGDAHRRAR